MSANDFMPECEKKKKKKNRPSAVSVAAAASGARVGSSISPRARAPTPSTVVTFRRAAPSPSQLTEAGRREWSRSLAAAAPVGSSRRNKIELARRSLLPLALPERAPREGSTGEQECGGGRGALRVQRASSTRNNEKCVTRESAAGRRNDGTKEARCKVRPAKERCQGPERRQREAP